MQYKYTICLHKFKLQKYMSFYIVKIKFFNFIYNLFNKIELIKVSKIVKLMKYNLFILDKQVLKNNN